MLSAARFAFIALAALPASVSSLKEPRELHRRDEFIDSFWAIAGPSPIDVRAKKFPLSIEDFPILTNSIFFQGTPVIRFQSRENGTGGWDGIEYDGGGYLWTPKYAGTFGLR